MALICRICGATCRRVVDLGMHAFADSFLPKPYTEGGGVPLERLAVTMCESCGGVQNELLTRPEERYNLVPYSYTSANSSFSRLHWQRLATLISDIFVDDDVRILEIGSNDGYLLSLLSTRFDVSGVDASERMVDLCRSRYKLNVWTEIFGKDSHAQLEQYGLIIANNVFNHSDDPVSFLTAVENLLCDDGTFLFEVPYWLRGFECNGFDQIYHEHVSYFTVKFIQSLCDRTNMSIITIEEIDYHGGSLRVWLKKGKGHIKEEVLASFLSREISGRVFEEAAYVEFMTNIEAERRRIISQIEKYRSSGYKIFAAGAAAKGNTRLTYFGLNREWLDGVLDSSVEKIGKYTPHTNLEIFNDNIVTEYDKVAVYILSWNIRELISSKLGKMNPNLKFIA